jgi:tetratricopeptide (TPR) repeat protein
MEKSGRIKQFENILARDPLDSTTCFGLGQAYFTEGFDLEAEQTLKKGLKLNSDHTASYYLLSQVLNKLGKREELIAILKKGIEVGNQQGDRIPTEKMIARLHRITKETKPQ